MTTVGRRITITATALAVAAALIGVYYYARTDATDAGSAVAVKAASLSMDDLHYALLPQNLHPQGTTYQEATIAEANAVFAAPSGITIQPESCLAAVPLTLGRDAKVDGWIQAGLRPTGKFQAAIGQVAGGLDVDQLRAVVGTCSAGKITWEALGISATIKLSEVAVPAIDGARTFGYKATIQFTNVTPEQLALAMPDEACAIAAAANAAVAEKSSCASPLPGAVKRKAMNLTVEEYFSYAAIGDVYAETCEAQLTMANDMLSTIVGRLQSTQS